MLYLLLLKVKFPKKVFLLRGNHECETISSFYGFRNECASDVLLVFRVVCQTWHELTFLFDFFRAR